MSVRLFFIGIFLCGVGKLAAPEPVWVLQPGLHPPAPAALPTRPLPPPPHSLPHQSSFPTLQMLPAQAILFAITRQNTSHGFSINYLWFFYICVCVIYASRSCTLSMGIKGINVGTFQRASGFHTWNAKVLSAIQLWPTCITQILSGFFALALEVIYISA